MRSLLLHGLAAAVIGFSGAGSAAVLVASYGFNNTLGADQSGVASLVAVDPMGAASFQTALVNGQNQHVYTWGGSGSSPTLQGGLSLDATGLTSYDNYSLEMVFRFNELAQFSVWRRIVDTQNRQSDNGFYVDPNNVLQVYPVVAGSTVFTTGDFHNVVMTNFVVNGVREVKAYLDGVLELQSNTDQLNLDNLNNPGHLLHFFVDNLAGPAQLEWAAGSIASLKVYDGIIVPNRVPEPASAALVALALAGLAGLGRVRRRATRS